ncbi:MAG: hypothetical protein NVS3B12_18410 [Acidimicrobiales bacterium]
MTSPVVWYAARSAGLVAWTLLLGSTLLGLVVGSRIVPLRAGRAWAVDLHQGLSGLAVTFVAVHVGAIYADGYIPFSVIDVVVPMASRWHPVWMAWGIVAMWLLVAVEGTALARRRLPRRLWRRVHLASTPLFVLATVHALVSGTDTGSIWILSGAVLGVMVVGFLSATRWTARGTMVR